MFLTIPKYLQTCIVKKSQSFQSTNLVSDEIVISGVSGRFPQAENINDFKKLLLNGSDMTSVQTRFTFGSNITPRMGLLENLSKFDADFFGLSTTKVFCLDPSVRKLIEVIYETILDAGINPESLRGSQTPVIIGSDGQNTGTYWLIKHGREELRGHTKVQQLTCFQANYVSHALDLRGTSFALGSACSTSCYAIETAVNSILADKCDRAIVGASVIHHLSHEYQNFSAIGATSPDGVCRSFDKKANGFVRAEAVVAILLERKNLANRKYATIKGVATNSDGYKSEGIFHPSSQSQENLYQELYSKLAIDPATVSYIEAHGTGTQAGDSQEILGLCKYFASAPGRIRPLLIGSVKSNMGHGEATAGICGVAKTIVCAQNRMILPSVNFNEPLEISAHLFEGSVKVVTEPEPLSSNLIGINSFGFGGTNGHLILQLESEQSAQSFQNEPSGFISSLVVPFSGQSEKDVQDSLGSALNSLNSVEGTFNQQFCGLLHQIYVQPIVGHNYRGYGIIQGSSDPTETSVCVADTRVAQVDSSAKQRPVWFVFAGMGSQWVGMGKELRQIDAFNSSLEKSITTCKNLGLDIEDALFNASMYSNALHATTGIAAIEIALHDTFSACGVNPNGIIGYSSGEIICAYADGCISAEEAILISHACGRFLEETKQEGMPRQMANVGLSPDQVQNKCLPSDIDVACINSPNNVTICGSQSSVEKFLLKLETEGIFCKLVNSCGVTAHCPNQSFTISTDVYTKYVDDILKSRTFNPSKRWISSCIYKSMWKIPEERKLSDYLSFNLANHVLFHEALQQVPQDAICIEIAPRNLLNSILKSVLHDKCNILSPMDDKPKERLHYFFSFIGDLYNSGCNFEISLLYPPIQFPVAARTPFVSSLVKWNHEKDWIVPNVEISEKYTDGIMNIDLNDNIYNFLEGHMLENRIIVPAAQYLCFAWKSLAASLGKDYTNLKVTFEDLSFERAVFLNHDNITQLRFSMQKGTGSFEITENSMTAVKGKIQGELAVPTIFPAPPKRFNTETNALEAKDFYKLLKLAGYNFQNYFQSLTRMQIEGEWGEVIWKDNWTTYIDSVLQASFTDIPCKYPEVPTFIKTFEINPKELERFIEADSNALPVINHIAENKTIAPGLKISNIVSNTIHNRVMEQNILNKWYTFVPYFQIGSSCNACNDQSSWTSVTLTSLVDLVFEHVFEKELGIKYIFSQSDLFILPILNTIIENHPIRNAAVTTISTYEAVQAIKENSENNSLDPSSLDTIVCRNSVDDDDINNYDAQIVVTDNVNAFKQAANNADPSSWILFYSTNSEALEIKEFLSNTTFLTVAEHSHDTYTILLAKQKHKILLQNIASLSLDGKKYEWVTQLQNLLTDESVSRIYIYSQNNSTSGITGFANSIKQEINGHKIRCIHDPQGELKLNFSKPCPLLQDLISKDLLMNVFLDKNHGSFRFITLSSNLSTEQTVDAQYVYVSVPDVETLDNLRWIESPLKLLDESSDNSKMYKVKCAAVNFKDLMLATGKLNESSSKNGFSKPIGAEFSGTDKYGARVMGMAPNAFATHVLDSSRAMILEIPPHWSFEEAATVPAAYFTVYHAFTQQVKLKPGSTVLIHSGTGAVGQAAINFALRKNCRVFTSVGSAEKRSYIKQLFPSLSESNICSSQDCSFEGQILRGTHGLGVDYVLNSLAGPKLHASLNCTAPGGIFLEIGRFDMQSGTQLDMRHLQKSIKIHGVDLMKICYEQIEGKKELVNLLRNEIANGFVQPLPYTIFPHNNLKDALRHMEYRKHVGKIVIQIGDSGKNAALPPTSSQGQEECVRIKNTTKVTYFDPKKVYIVIGGLGGFGIEVANWLVEKGAANLVLVSRSKVTTGYQKYRILSWLKQGVNVKILNTDLSNFAAAKLFIEKLSQGGGGGGGGGVGGIFNLGMALHDAAFVNQTKEMFKEATRPKIDITHNLDIVTRSICPSLEYFTAFSSLASGIGNKGVSNYALSNSGMEQVCFMRREAGFEALGIQWGVIGEAGYAAERMSSDTKFFKLAPQTMANCLQALEEFLIESKQDEPSSSSGKKCLTTIVVDKMNNVQHQKLLKRKLTEQISQLCSIKTPLTDIEPTKSLSDLGLDSLSRAELRQILNRDYDVAVNIAAVMSLTWGQVTKIEETNVRTGTGNQDQKLNGQQLTDNNSKRSVSILNKLESKCSSSSGSLSPIFIVHGADGLAENFIGLASNLTRDVYAFQTVLDSPAPKVECMSCQDIATYYIEEIQKIQPTGPYNICGNSGGGVIALEIARQLEFIHQELVDNVIMLDGFCFYNSIEQIDLRPSMVFFTHFLDDVFPLLDDEKQMFLDNIHPTSEEKNRKLILNFLEQKLQGNEISSFPKEFFKRAITLAMKFFAYNPSESFKIKARLHLIKARYFKEGIDTKSCYNFQQFCENPVVESTVNGDHFSFLHLGNVEAASEIVNNILLSKK